MTPHLEIVQSDGSSERYPLGGSEHIIVGRQPREGIALPHAGELELEHLRLTPRPGGCWVGVAGGVRTPLLVGGEPFAGGLVPWGSSLQLGSLWLRLTDELPEGARGRRVGGVGLLAALAMVGAAAWLIVPPGAGQGTELGAVPPPALFPAALPACPEAEAGAAAARAREVAEAALAKAERYPFASQDGVRAVELYGVAAGCFTAGGKRSEAERVARERTALARRLEEDYRTHRLKLERAIEYGRTREALVESRELLALVAHLDHPYTHWLRAVERRLSLKTEAPK
jgi:hypothetical protein